MWSADLLQALNNAVWQSNSDLSELLHHPDRGSEGGFRPIAGYTDRLPGLGITPSVGSRGDSYTAPSARPPTFREAAMIVPKAFVKAILSRSGVVQASAR
jgi:hypothetical protein